MKLNDYKKACLAVGLVLCTLFSSCSTGTARTQSGLPAEGGNGASSQQNFIIGDNSRQDEISGDITIYLEATYADELVQYPILQAIQTFAAQHPAVTIRFESPVGGVNDYDAREAEITRLNTEIMAGGGPDLFLLGYRFTNCNLFPDLQKAMRNGAFVDSAPLLAPYGIDCAGEDFWQGVMQAGRVDDAQYIVPLSFDLAVGLADKTTLEQSGFERDTALTSTANFVSECARVQAENPALTTFLSTELTQWAALEPLDYDSQTVHLGDDAMRQMLELDRAVWKNTTWRQGDDDFRQEYNADGSEAYEQKEAGRLANGQRLMDLWGLSDQIGTAWAMTAQNDNLTVLPLPNETGGVTANIGCYAAINANSQNADAAAALLAYLLGNEAQGMGAYPCELLKLPVRKNSLASSLQSAYDFQKNLWWMHPTEEKKKLYEEQLGEAFVEKTEEEKAAYLESLGQPLTSECAQNLLDCCTRINAAHLQSLWYNSINLGQTPNGDDLITSTYCAYENGEITVDRLIDTLEPRLQLYLEE